MSGVTTTGFVAKSQEDLVTEITAAIQTDLGASWDCSAESPTGQLISIFAERVAEMWEVQEQVYAAFTADGATGQSLDNVCGLTATVRQAAKRSTVTTSVAGVNGTVVPPGTLLAVAGIGTQFRTIATATIATAASWAATTGYAVGDTKKNGGNLYRCITPGTSAGSGGPTGTGSAITDGSCVWEFILAGTAFVDIACESVDTGPNIAAAGTLTSIVTPVGGLTSVTNLLDADLGANIESDASLRARRENELRAQGAAALESIRDSLLHDVAGVTACVVLENPSDTTDGDGLPPHSIECLVTDGADADIAEKIWREKAAGIQTYGSTSATVTDSQEIDHTINFSRPTLRDVYVTYDLVVDPNVWPADGVAEVKAAAIAYGLANLVSGKDVVASALVAPAFSIPGVLDAPAPKIGLAPSPGATTTIVNTIRQQGVLDTSRIVVNTTDGTP